MAGAFVIGNWNIKFGGAGLQLLSLSTVLIAVARVYDTYLARELTPELITFTGYLVPCFLLLVLRPNSILDDSIYPPNRWQMGNHNGDIVPTLLLFHDASSSARRTNHYNSPVANQYGISIAARASSSSNTYSINTKNSFLLAVCVCCCLASYSIAASLVMDDKEA